MPKKEADPGRSAPKNKVDDMRHETTPEQPIVKMPLRDMVRKAKRDAARAEQRASEAAKEKFNAVLDEFAKPFPEGLLSFFVPCHRASKKPVASWKRLTQVNWAEPDNLCLLSRQIVMGGNLAIKL